MLKIILSCFILTMYTFFQADCFAEEIISRYATITFADTDLLHEFNDNVYIRSRQFQFAKKKTGLTVEDEVKNKIDVIVEKVEVVLDMFPAKIAFKVVLLPNHEEVKKVHQGVYHKGADYIAFFSPKTNAVYVSVDDVDLKIFSHEIGHVIVENYFKVSPPAKMHELLAQFAAAHIND